MAGELVEMVVESVRVHMSSSRHVVILKDTERERYLPIWVGPWEANAIALRLQGQTPERPMTHDLFAATLEELGARVDRVVITELADETFFARVHLEDAGRAAEVDARPSDALALAVRTGARIYADEAVLEQAAWAPGEGEGQVGPPSEETGEVVPDERLGVFRDFVNSLDIDLGGSR
jgi:bifunctional DNase/RNase